MVDSHCHLADDAFASDLTAVVGRAREAGVERALVILAAGDQQEAVQARTLEELWPEVRFAVGVHPHQAHEFGLDSARAVDTVKEADAGGRVIATLERASLWVVQTPQAFQPGPLLKALGEGDLSRATDDAQLVEAVGGDIRVVEAPRHNLKVTNEQDLRIAELLLADLA